MPQQLNNPNELSTIAARIDLLIETVNKRFDSTNEALNKRFDDVRQEMVAAMDRYVLKQVHELEIKRLDEKDRDQQDALDELETRVLGTSQRYLINAAAAIGAIGGIIALLHTLHIF